LKDGFLPLLFIGCRRGGVRLKHGAVSSLAASEGIKAQTLAHKWDKFVAQREEGMGEEVALAAADCEHRGGHNRALTTEQQMILREDIVARVHNREPVTDGDVRILGQQYWQQLHGRRTRAWQFDASKGWVWAFKTRWGLDSRRPRTFAPTLPPDPALDAKFIADCKTWLDRVGPALFINLDETSWKLSNPLLSVLAPHGERARVNGGADRRACFTAVFAACANGHKLQPAIIKECKTERGLRPLVAEYGKRARFMKQASGWSSAKGMVEIIEHIIAPYTAGRQAAIILDMFSGHTEARVRAALARHNIIPLWVPANSTATRQPLDAAPFGVVKSYARGYWHWRRSALLGGSGVPLTMQMAVGDALRSWRQIGAEVVRKGFKLALELSSIPLSHRSHPVIVLERHPTTIYSCTAVGLHKYRKPFVRLLALRPGPILFQHKRFSPPAPRRTKKKKAQKRAVKPAS
jgi:hypothetical protein